jgi:FAD dependent oxidoreductase TIGR03364
LAIVGAGIVGLAHAYQAARRGLRVVVFERNARATGASIRNFGMILPIGMAAGPMLERALRSRGIWLDLAARAGFWHNPAGAVFLAYAADELQVLGEFAARASALGYQCQLLDAAGVLARSQAVKTQGLLGGLFSATEIVVDPREAVVKLAAYLQAECGVEFHFGQTVTAIEPPRLIANGEAWLAERVTVCGGADFETLFPDLLRHSGLTRCKLQMMRTQPQPGGWQLGPLLATGLSLGHYAAFAGCPSLPALRARLAQEFPELERWGIHVLVSQNGLGELTLGDSHEYGLEPDPFDKPEIDALILRQAQTFLNAPSCEVSQRWHGVYAKHLSQDTLVLRPHPNVAVVNGVGGAGMTISFGLAEETLDSWN